MTPVPTEARLLSEIDFDRLPQHIAVIMDGNGRWAKKRHLPRIAGHRAGIKAVRQAVEACARLGVPYLTLYAFSVENWKRPQTEVKMLMDLLREYLNREIGELNRQNIRLHVIGRLAELPALVQRDISKGLRETSANTGMLLTFALNYGARTELADAVRSLLEHVQRNGKNVTLDEESVRAHLYTHDMPDPDLLIRTSGEMRVSNFLLWQIAYAEIWVTDTLWPDFTQLDLLTAILDYQKRERRYGGLGREPTIK
ncbi:MAG TPA: isoprenyl transferase [Terriglobia bacterium]|nr:isoprenyl transferase [Terriglobia bacterium]